MSPSVQKAIGNTEFAKRHENGGSDKQQTEKQQKIRRTLTYPNVYSAVEGEDADERRERSTESNPGRCGSHLC